MSLATNANRNLYHSYVIWAMIVLQNLQWTLTFFFAFWDGLCLIIPREGKSSKRSNIMQRQYNASYGNLHFNILFKFLVTYVIALWNKAKPILSEDDFTIV